MQAATRLSAAARALGGRRWLRVGDRGVRLRRDAAARQIVILRVLPRGRAYER